MKTTFPGREMSAVWGSRLYPISSSSCDLWGEVANQPDSVAADLLDVGAHVQALQLGVEDDGSAGSYDDNRLPFKEPGRSLCHR